MNQIIKLRKEKKMKIIKSISITKETWELAKKIAKEQDRTISNLIETLIKKEGGK